MSAEFGMPKNVIIVGMARSGTSLTASIFAKKGYFVADDPDKQLQAGNRHNPGGFWELDDLVEAIGLPFEKLCTHCWDNSSYS